MYNNIGNKIKKLTVTITNIGYGFAALIGVLGLISMATIGAAGLSLVVMGIGCGISTWISSWFIYAFGELVQNSTDIRNKLVGENVSNSAETPSNGPAVMDTLKNKGKINELNKLKASGLVTEEEYHAKMAELEGE